METFLIVLTCFPLNRWLYEDGSNVTELDLLVREVDMSGFEGEVSVLLDSLGLGN